MRRLIFYVAMFVCCLGANAQYTGQTNPNCIGLKNPANFTLSGSHGEKWTGYTGSRNEAASTCYSEGGTYNQTIQAANLEGTSNNPSSSACNILLDNSSTRSTSRDIHNNLDHANNFVIKGPGTDPETFGHLSYLPPDTSFHTSIRLGNYCGYAGAEKLTYEIQVRPDNALITIWYALSLQNGQHSAANNPEFVIVVEKNTGTTASPNWQPLAHDTLCYIRSTPTSSSSDVSPFYVGSTGSHTGATYGSSLYLPWQKVMINLSDYCYQTVRIKITAGDCSYTIHYALAYIAGDCQSLDLRATGCTAGESDAVTTIYAPKGAIGYEWYRSKTGQLVGAQQSDESNYVQIAGATADSLDATLEHFRNVNTGDIASQSTFMCKMTTKMNDSIAVTSNTFTNVGNIKPCLSVDSVLDCNAGITLYDLSYTPYAPHDTNQVDTNLTRWEFYTSNPPTPETLDSTYTGGHATHTYAQAGTNYSVKVRTSAVGTSCWNEKTIPIRTRSSVTADTSILAYDSVVWNGETYTESGTYTWTGVTSEGCDSTVTLTLTIEQVGIEALDGTAPKVKLYPNPTSGWLNIEGDEVIAVEVLDLSGHKVMESAGANRIYIGALPKGAYVVRTACSHGIATHRVVLE